MAATIDSGAKLSDQLERWLNDDDEPTLGGLVDAFGDKSFAILFVLLLGVPALPLPIGTRDASNFDRKHVTRHKP